jgi:Uma2 family endonuclease
MSIANSPLSLSDEPTPVWGIAQFFPPQGGWTEGDYYAIDAKRSLEFKDGKLEVLPMPTVSHELIVRHLFRLLSAFVSVNDLGEVFFAGMKWRPREGLIRMPDVMFVATENLHRVNEQAFEHFNLTMEVVSPDAESYKRDHADKRIDYAEHGVREYWIVDPQERRILVHTLEQGRYRLHEEYLPGMQASSSVLSGFAADVTAVLDAAKSLG